LSLFLAASTRRSSWAYLRKALSIACSDIPV
jgi:hypothetical protein